MQDLDIRGAGNLMGAEQSGFIAEIGFETYHQILNEAMQELHEEEDLLDAFAERDRETAQPNATAFPQSQSFIGDCQIDTDFELLFPNEYIENVSERIHLYRELDNIDTEDKLTAFEQSLVDRFGAIPVSGKELIDVVRLRWLATHLGFEKIILRNERLLAYFISNPKSPYYQSDTFTHILQNIQQNPRLFHLKEAKDKLAMTISPVKSIGKSMEILEGLRDRV
jgi:transcription-repair coupling factor (superfamily II helicase)